MTDRLSHRIARAALAAALVIANLAEADSELELCVKAAFLFNFARFATWPLAIFSSDQSSIYLCVLDANPLGDARGHGAGQEHRCASSRSALRQGGRRIARLPCRLLGRRRWAEDRDHVGASHERGGGLSVYEGDHALKSGVARFYLNDRRVRLELNLAAADQEQVQLSSRLQGAAAIVRQ